MWFIYVMLSVIFLSAIEIFYKLYTDRNTEISSNIASIPVNVFMLICSVPFLFTAPIALGAIDIPWMVLIVENLVFVLAVALFYESYKHLSASIATILGTSSSIMSAVLGIRFFNESFSYSKVAGIALIIVSIAFLHWERTKVNLKAYLLALTGGLAFGVGYAMDKYIITIENLSVDHFQFLYALIALPLKSLVQPRDLIPQLKMVNPKSLIYAFGAGFCIIIAYKFSLTAIEVGGEIGRIDAINNVSIFVIILAEVLLLKSREDIPKKVFCAALAVAGVLLLK